MKIADRHKYAETREFHHFHTRQTQPPIREWMKKKQYKTNVKKTSKRATKSNQFLRLALNHLENVWIFLRQKWGALLHLSNVWALKARRHLYGLQRYRVWPTGWSLTQPIQLRSRTSGRAMPADKAHWISCTIDFFQSKQAYKCETHQVEKYSKEPDYWRRHCVLGCQPENFWREAAHSKLNNGW